MPFAQVLINHAYARKQGALTYEIPEHLSVENGSGVLVPFQKGERPGLVLGISQRKPEFEARNILELLDPSLLLRDWQLQLAEWISEYYFCSKYDAVRLMLPKHIWRKPKKARQSKAKSREKQPPTTHELTPEQAQIVEHILHKKPPHSLLHGITGSGKTEVYKHLIQAKTKAGQQALLLVPEIALTPQLLQYFQGNFPDLVVIHSRISDGERAKAWRRIQNGNCPLVIGSRSALFSPFKALSLIIMDEEHEWTYKQEQSPRYHARDVALKISELTGAQLLMGSATPSVESYWKAQKGIFQLFELHKRIGETPLPKVEIVDMREELKQHNFSIFSDTLEQKIESKLAAKQQIILFLNRRGSASATVCRDCGLALECSHCDTKLTYHARKFAHQTLVCHHCGRISQLANSCPNCKSLRIKHLGLGTERVEHELQKRFPTARIFRADRDTMQNKNSFKNLHKQLREHEIDILIGTQMIAKGLDLPKVSLVGVILADMGLHLPDFRASERSFQLLTQVAGRAGRRDTQGEVVIQTYSPEHPSLQAAAQHDYHALFEQEISSREGTHYPPFSQLIKLTHVNADKKICQASSEKLLKHLQQIDDGTHQLYTAPALIPRVNNRYYWHLFIHGPQPRKLIKKIDQESLANWRIDVDPVHCV